MTIFTSHHKVITSSRLLQTRLLRHGDVDQSQNVSKSAYFRCEKMHFYSSESRESRIFGISALKTIVLKNKTKLFSTCNWSIPESAGITWSLRCKQIGSRLPVPDHSTSVNMCLAGCYRNIQCLCLTMIAGIFSDLFPQLDHQNRVIAKNIRIQTKRLEDQLTGDSTGDKPQSREPRGNSDGDKSQAREPRRNNDTAKSQSRKPRRSTDGTKSQSREPRDNSDGDESLSRKPRSGAKSQPREPRRSTDGAKSQSRKPRSGAKSQPREPRRSTDGASSQSREPPEDTSGARSQSREPQEDTSDNSSQRLDDTSGTSSQPVDDTSGARSQPRESPEDTSGAKLAISRATRGYQ